MGLAAAWALQARRSSQRTARPSRCRQRSTRSSTSSDTGQRSTTSLRRYGLLSTRRSDRPQEFLLLFDEDRAHLLAELAEHNTREFQGRADQQALEDELSARAEVLRATMEQSEAELAQSAAEYQTLRAEAQQLAAALADNETKLANARLERESAVRPRRAGVCSARRAPSSTRRCRFPRELRLEQTIGEREGESRLRSSVRRQLNPGCARPPQSETPCARRARNGLLRARACR